MYSQRFSVSFAYDVVFTRDVFAEGNSSLATVLGTEEAKLVAVLDSGLVAAWPGTPRAVERWCSRHGRFQLACPPHIVEGGEKAKNSLEILDEVGRLAADAHLSRSDYVLIIGGGAVLDAVGFAASTVHRGIRHVRIPTTAISQGDSGVGVKNSLNRFGHKNYYGAFVPPHAVVNDTNFLRTLSDRDWAGGIAESFKVAVIKDAAFLDSLLRSADLLHARNLDVMEEVVRRTAILHLDHIRTSGDPFERGSARPLDFGHWAAHRLESLSGHRLGHGQAVAIGMAIDLVAASRMGLIASDEVARILGGLERCGLPLWDPLLDERLPDGKPAILLGLAEFAEHLGGKLTLAMPRGVGRMTFVHDLPETLVKDALEHLRQRSAQ